MNDADRKAFEEAEKTMSCDKFSAGWKAACEWRDSQDAQINQQLVEALDKLHAVVIAKNRAGADWGEQFSDLMVALSLAQAALAATQMRGDA